MEIERWSGREARALREAMRMSVRAFSAFLGVSGRTISAWEEDGGVKIPRPDSQALLDTALARANEEVRERFQQLLGHQRVASLGSSVFIPPLEPTMIDRSADHENALALLVEAARSDEISVVAIAGPGGFGKTTLALQLAHDGRVRDRFPEVVWVETGEDCTPARVVELISDLCVHLDGTRPALHDPEQAGFHLARVLAERSVLLVVDNVWSAADLQPFLLGAPACVRLITTRNVRTCPSGSRVFRLGPMTAREVAELISRSVPVITPAGALDIADLCRGWPLLANVVGASLNQDLQAGASASQAVALAAEALQTHGPSAFDVWDGDQRRNAIGHAIAASLASLDTSVSIGGRTDVRDRYLSLAIFPASSPVPLSVLVRWWQQLGWSTNMVRQFCRILADRSLISAYLADRDAIVLHDVFRAHLRDLVANQWVPLHQSLLSAVRPTSGDWLDLDHADRYMWRHLSYHLAEAGEPDELLSCFSDRDLVATKSHLCGYQTLSADLHAVSSVIAAQLDATSQSKHTTALVLTGQGHMLYGLASLEDVKVTLEIALLRAGISRPQAEDASIKVHSVEPPLRTVGQGHIGAVVTVDVRGGLVSSAGEDGIIRLWSLANNELVAQLGGHTGWVYTTAILPDGRRIASAGDDGPIRLWDIASQSQVGMLPGHSRRIRALAVTSDGRRLISGAEDGQIVVWDLDKRTAERRLATSGTPVWSVAVVDDQMVVAGGEDEYLRLYDLNSGSLLDEQAGHRDWIRSVTATAPTLIASGSGDGSVCVWDTSTRRLVQQRRADDLPERVRAVALTSGGRLTIAACEDATLRAFTVHGAAGVVAMPQGVDWIRSIAPTDDGSVIAGCEDGGLRLWPTAAASQPIVISEGRNTAWSVAMANGGAVTLLGHGDGTIVIQDETDTTTRRRVSAGHGRVWSLDAAEGYFAAASGDGAIRAWSLHDEAFQLTLNTEMRRSWAVALSTDGSLLAGSDQRGHTRVWRVQTGELLWDHNAKAGRLRSLAFSADGVRLAACGGDGTVVVWHMGTGETLAQISNKGAWARAVALDSTGAKALIGMGTGEVHYIDLDAHQTLAELTAHKGRVLLVGFTTSQDHVVSAAADGTACLWSTTGQQLVSRVRADTSGQCAAFDYSSGKLILVGANGITTLTINVGNER